MQTVFSTDEISPGLRSQMYHEFYVNMMGPVHQTYARDRAMTAKIEAADLGALGIVRMTTNAGVRTETTPRTISRCSKQDKLFVSLTLSGRTAIAQGGRQSIQGIGDIVVCGSQPCVVETGTNSRNLFVELPRERLERMLGPADLYTALRIGSELPSTRLTADFFEGLAGIYGDLDDDTAVRMAGIGVDLIMASIAARLAQDVPRPLYGSVIVQRAKAYIEANLGAATLDAPQVAAALGLSPRRLQELFQERGQYVHGYIWERRLALAAARLADPQLDHMQIGTLAQACGFRSQAHFTRRFKEGHGLTPSEYRRMKAEAKPRAWIA